MGDDWRVCLSGDLPGQLTADEVYTRYPASAKEAAEEESFRQALISALGSRLGDQVAVSSRLWGTQIFVYAPSIGLADQAAQVAGELLASHGIKARILTEFWSLREQQWQDADDPSAGPAAQRPADRPEAQRHADRQEAERKRSVRTGVPAWQVRIEVSSHREAIALAGHLAAQGWRVRRRPRSVIVSANCEDDAKGLGRALSGDGRADTDTDFRVRRVSYRYMYNEIYVA